MAKVLLLRMLSIVAVLCMAIAPLASAGMGQALYERWSGGGYDTDGADSMLTLTSVPDYTEILTSTQWGVGDDNSVEDYRSRITAWLFPPVTGDYVFWITSDDGGRLWLSTDHDPANARLIAEVSNYVGEDEWGDIGDESRSVAITLEGGEAYWLRGGHQEGDGGDHFRIAWGCTSAGIGDHTIITGQFISDVNPFYASVPNPADGAVNVLLEDVQLSWSGPALYPDATYTVYFGSDANDLPLLDSGLTETTVNTGMILRADETYSWQVDVSATDEGGDPVLYTGDIWGFTTAPKSPVILVQPQDAYVFAGETASFTIDAYSANDEALSYAWFKESEPGNILSTTDTLTIPNAQLDDETTYQCTLTNAHGEVTSEAVWVVIKRILGHWPFNQDVTDIVGGNDGTVKKPVYVEGIVDDYAIEFSNAGGASGVEISATPYTTKSWTISFWEKASMEQSGDDWEVMVGSGGEIGYGILDIGRYRMTQYHFALDDVYVYTPLSEAYYRGEWNILTLTYDSTTKYGTLYLNGLPLIELSRDFSGFVDPLIFVGDSIVGEYPFYGVIDDLRFYSYALNPLEVALLYTDVGDETVCFQNPSADISGQEGDPDCIVDIYDLVEVAGAWLECNRVPAENCL
jgi:hypothetical protein